jgi:hypothetical protein
VVDPSTLSVPSFEISDGGDITRIWAEQSEQAPISKQAAKRIADALKAMVPVRRCFASGAG